MGPIGFIDAYRMPELYLVALLPPPQISEELHEIRLECSRKFGVFKALRPPVHITLYPPFHAEESFESQLAELLRQGTDEIPSFTLQLENFGSFDRKVVYINAIKSPELVSLQRAVVSVIANNQIDRQLESRKDQPFKPHITIAYRDIPRDTFPLIWKEYKDRQLKVSFKAEYFSLLTHKKSGWMSVEDFKLGTKG